MILQFALIWVMNKGDVVYYLTFTQKKTRNLSLTSLSFFATQISFSIKVRKVLPKKISSNMEVASRYTLLTLCTLFTLFTQ